MPRNKAKRCEISVRQLTFDKLETAARRNGEQVGTFTDALLNAYLDEIERKRNQ